MFVIKGGISTKKEIIDIGNSIPRLQTMKDLCDCLLGWESEMTTFQVFGSRMTEHKSPLVTPCCKSRHWHHVNRSDIPKRVLCCELCDQMFDAERLEELP
jgi:hypothetical protein